MLLQYSPANFVRKFTYTTIYRKQNIFDGMYLRYDRVTYIGV